MADNDVEVPADQDVFSDASRASRRVLELVGLVAAPITILGAVAYYIGVVRQRAIFDHFGLQVGMVEYSYQDYVLRSSDALVRFVAATAMIALLFLVLVPPSLRFLEATTHRSVLPASVLIGISCLVVAASRLFDPPRFTWTWPLGPLCLAAGAALGLVVLNHVRNHSYFGGVSIRTSRLVRTSVLSMLMSLLLVALFWAANDFARLHGSQRGADLTARIDLQPQVIVHSTDHLGISGPGVTTERSDETRRFPFRTAGLRLLLQDDDRYFLLPEEWSRDVGSVILLDENPDMMLEVKSRWQRP